MSLSSVARIALGTFHGTDEQRNQQVDVPIQVEMVEHSQTDSEPAATLVLEIDYPATFNRTVSVPLPCHTLEKLHETTGEILREDDT